MWKFIVISVIIVIAVGMCVAPFMGFNKLPSGDDEIGKN